jgi:hypothetical protein
METTPTSQRRIRSRSAAPVRAGLAVRLVSAALAVIFAAAAVHSTVFIFVHADHSHAHGDYDQSCDVCAHLASAGSLMASFSPPVADTPRAAVFFNQFDADQKIIYSYNDVSTPVLLKVRLNN